jgi:hypothetical protein
MNEEAVRELTLKISEHERRLHEGDISLALLHQLSERVQADLSEVKAMLKNMQDRPARHWESIVSCIINWAVAALLAYIALGR